jgi:uncharacterized protein (DUF2252 family)
MCGASEQSPRWPIPSAKKRGLLRYNDHDARYTDSPAGSSNLGQRRRVALRQNHARQAHQALVDGWLTSIHTLAAGTLVAVFAGQVASRWSDEVARIEHERTRLLAA